MSTGPERGPGRRARWTDAVLIMLAALLGGLFFVDAVTTDGDRGVGFPTLDLMVGALACAGLLLRRRRPVAVAVACIPSLALSASAMGATAVAIGAVAAYRPWRVTAVTVAAHATTVIALFALTARSTGQAVQGVLVLLALDAATVSTGLLVRSQRRLVESLTERARDVEERHRLQVVQARHTERERIAREMHDVLAHRISLLAMHAGALEVRRAAPQAERRAAGVLRECAHEALEDLRTVIGMLRGEGEEEDDRPQPTLVEIPALIEQSRRTGTQIALENQVADLSAAPDRVGRHVYRVIQEAVTNARKHAPGQPVTVRLTRDGDVLTVEISNPLPAVAATPLPGAGSGLIGLRERMDLLGGRLDHGQTTTGQFRLRASVPWPT